MNAYDLDILRQNRQEILKAELGAFLHNIGKFGQEFINWSHSGVRFGYQHVVGVLDDIVKTRRASLARDVRQRFEQSLKDLNPALTSAFLPANGAFAQWLRRTEITLPHPFDDRNQYPYHIADLIEFQDRKWYEDNSRRIRDLFGTTSRLTELLEASHHVSALDKNLDGDGARQTTRQVFQASVFGHERPIDTAALKPARNSLLVSIQQSGRNEYVEEARELMTLALAETRRPLNDITLWDVSLAVAAFFKAALAKMLLEGKWTERKDLRWRILRIALDGPAFYEHVSRLPDLLARKQIATHGLDAVRELLEQQYPLGNEVYRDEFGSAFVVPDLDGDDRQGKVLLGLIETRIRDAFVTPVEAVHGDARQRERSEASKAVKLEIEPRLSASPMHAQGLGLAEELAKPVALVTPKPQTMRRWWQVGKPADVCTVCNLRPQGLPPSRPSGKARERRVCVPCEALRDDRCEEWLNKLETTIWLDEVADVSGRVALITGRFGIDKWLKPGGYAQSSLVVNSAPSLRFKEVTFARLRRIWDTTARFWEEIETEILRCVIRACAMRWRLTVQPLAGHNNPPVRTHAYQLEIPDIGRLAVASADEGGWKFITAENLARLAKFHETSPDKLRDKIRGKQCTVLEDKYNDEAGYTRLTTIARGRILEVDPDSVQYCPAISILKDPRSFMILIPAERAADIVAKIKRKYDTEMARVRNRLPIAVGMVFGRAHTPLAMMLDAGRRMLGLPVSEEPWTVSTVSDVNGGVWRLEFANGVAWEIPTVMGDGTTEDQWYAYFLAADSGGALHLSALRSGSKVYVTPSRFDFQFLDCAATRFELDYSEAGRKQRFPRPYLLEKWNDLARVWELLRGGLASSQIKAIQAEIGGKRRQWKEPGDRTLKAFVRDTLATARWTRPLSREDLDFLTRAGSGGLLEDAVELYLRLRKCKTEVGGDDE